MITHVAILFRGELYSLPAPNRHHDVIRHIVETTGVKSVGGTQGFLANGETYLGRKPALRHAIECNQLLPRATGHKLGELYSEDVW
jgi:hypothetical protein